VRQKPRVIAFYLPQFHPIPENDMWWGKGWTEWTNVGKAKPLFRRHYQPRVPADLGYYDLRLPETREAQAQMAREAGIEGFCYWHYWFGGGKRLLERPFNEVLESGKPDFPFCLGWANHDWKGFMWGMKNKKLNRTMLFEQKYPGVEDYTKHFYTMLPAFKDSRYIRVNDRPLFLIAFPLANPEIPVFIKTWRDLAVKNGLAGIYFVGQTQDYIEEGAKISGMDFDAINAFDLGGYRRHLSLFYRIIYKAYRELFHKPFVISYSEAAKYFFVKGIHSGENIIPGIVTGFDHTPRSGWQAIVMKDFTPEAFKKHVEYVIQNTNPNPNIVFIKSWNEWAEGNYIEPDLKYGTAFLDVLREVLC